MKDFAQDPFPNGKTVFVTSGASGMIEAGGGSI